MSDLSLPQLSPIPDLLPPASLAILTGASHSGKRELLLSTLAHILSPDESERFIFDPTRTPYSLSRPAPRVGFLTLTHGGNPATHSALFAQELAQHGLSWLLSRDLRPQFAFRSYAPADSPSELPCPLTPTILKQIFAGAFGIGGKVQSNATLPELLILDDLHSLLLDGKVNSYSAVSRLMQPLQLLLSDLNISLLALAPATKLKSTERYGKVPDRILGSVAWGAHAHSVWLVESDQEDEDAADMGAQSHSLTVVRRGADPEKRPLAFDSSGLLHPLVIHSDWREKLQKWLRTLPPNPSDISQPPAFTTAALTDYGRSLGVSRDQAKRFIAALESDGALVRLDKGVYRLARTC